MATLILSLIDSPLVIMETVRTRPVCYRDFARWVREVRDPAERCNEGMRRIETKAGNAVAEYRIAKLADDRWAMQSWGQYRCGNFRGSAAPWKQFESRERCVKVFLSRAKGMFGKELTGVVSESQRKAQEEMLCLLEEGLFGLVEPDPI